MSRTYRAMAHTYKPAYGSYQDHIYYDQTMPVERVRELYRARLRGEIVDEITVHRRPWHYVPYDLALMAHKTVFRNRCSYRQRMHAIALYKRSTRKSKRAKLKQELTREMIELEDQWPLSDDAEGGSSIALNDFI